MGLFRLIVIIAIGYLVFRLYRGFIAAQRADADRRSIEPQPMVRCEFCEVHLPRTKALAREGKWYCSPEHLQHHRGDA